VPTRPEEWEEGGFDMQLVWHRGEVDLTDADRCVLMLYVHTYIHTYICIYGHHRRRPVCPVHSASIGVAYKRNAVADSRNVA
jgi:hypothetical protein